MIDFNSFLLGWVLGVSTIIFIFKKFVSKDKDWWYVDCLGFKVGGKTLWSAIKGWIEL